MKHGSLFSGIGGFDLAAEWMGWENVFHCEWNPFGQKILKHYWPKALSYADITKTDFSIHRGRIDILTGGFPCQPYSVAGLQKGTDDERHLWPEMLRTAREVQPSWIVGENVRGIVNWNEGMVFEQVQTDLENEGYEVQSFILPACAVNAPHRRDRVWFIAHAKRQGLQRFNPQREDIRQHTEPSYAEHSNRNVFDWFQGLGPDSEHLRNGDGVPRKLHKESVKALGNAISPQVAHQIFKAIDQYENG